MFRVNNYEWNIQCDNLLIVDVIKV